jgi:DNA-binding transcriptional regulator WhiA
MSALASSSNYRTFYYILTQILNATAVGLKAKSNTKSAETYFKKGRQFYGFLKFVLDYHSGYLGFLWI